MRAKLSLWSIVAVIRLSRLAVFPHEALVYPRLRQRSVLHSINCSGVVASGAGMTGFEA